jgi:hypothetical protein
LMDHPEAIGILVDVLRGTSRLEAAQNVRGLHHEVKVYTTYLPKDEKRFDELLELAVKNQKRLFVTISLPLNRDDEVNKSFALFASERPDIFKGELDSRGFFNKAKGGEVKNISIKDVRQTTDLFMSGRVLPIETSRGRVSDDNIVDADRIHDFRQRGFVKTYLNPDALWLMVYATAYESHTYRAFTPITPENIGTFSSLQWHPDFTTPPNWPGGSGIMQSTDEGRYRRKEMESSGKQKKNPTISH